MMINPTAVTQSPSTVKALGSTALSKHSFLTFNICLEMLSYMHHCRMQISWGDNMRSGADDCQICHVTAGPIVLVI